MVKRWTAPLDWSGETAAILGSGPSMSQAVADYVRAADVRTIAINNTFRLAPWADVLYAADGSWWRETAEAQEFAGLRISCQPADAAHLIHNAGSVGYSDDPGCVHTYGFSGAQAIQIAAKAGAKRILLCGFDMHERDGSHWHGDHPKPLRNTSAELYAHWVDRMPALADALAIRGVLVLNCTPGSALTAFPFADLDQALAACRAR